MSFSGSLQTTCIVLSSWILICNAVIVLWNTVTTKDKKADKKFSYTLEPKANETRASLNPLTSVTVPTAHMMYMYTHAHTSKGQGSSFRHVPTAWSFQSAVLNGLLCGHYATCCCKSTTTRWTPKQLWSVLVTQLLEFRMQHIYNTL